MRLKYLLIATAIVMFIDGGCVLIPRRFLANCGVLEPSRSAVAMTQAFGAALLNYAFVAWFARNAPPSEARRAIVLGFLLTWLISLAVTFYVMVTGAMGNLTWLSALLYGLLAFGYGYFYLTGERV